jgi:hypothetical protein
MGEVVFLWPGEGEPIGGSGSSRATLKATGETTGGTFFMSETTLVRLLTRSRRDPRNTLTLPNATLKAGGGAGWPLPRELRRIV